MKIIHICKSRFAKITNPWFTNPYLLLTTESDILVPTRNAGPLCLAYFDLGAIGVISLSTSES